MSASDHVSRAELYHGTNTRFPSMAVLHPGREIGRSNYRDADDQPVLLDRVCMTPYRHVAEQCARVAADEHGGEPWVYRVRPLGAVERVADDESSAPRAQIVYGHRVWPETRAGEPPGMDL